MFLAQYQKQFALVAVLALLIAPVIGFSHAAIPHAHTHASDNALHAAIEHGLDGSLSRKDIVIPSFLLVFFLLLRIGRVAASTRTTSLHEAPLLQALRRGVLPHRKFG